MFQTRQYTQYVLRTVYMTARRDEELIYCKSSEGGGNPAEDTFSCPSAVCDHHGTKRGFLELGRLSCEQQSSHRISVTQEHSS